MLAFFEAGYIVVEFRIAYYTFYIYIFFYVSRDLFARDLFASVPLQRSTKLCLDPVDVFVVAARRKRLLSGTKFSSPNLLIDAFH